MSPQLSASPPLVADVLRDRTRALHTEAERSGIVAHILRGTATRTGYALFLRNLLPAYAALEAGLEEKRDDPRLSLLARPEIYRSAALRSDLASLGGAGWEAALPLLPEGSAYADRIEEAGRGDGLRLAAHAYVRYLGDLNGGQALKRVLARSLQLSGRSLAFYEFSGIDDLAGYRTRYRRAFALAARDGADLETMAVEACTAFTLNINVSEAVQAALGVCAEAASPSSALRC